MSQIALPAHWPSMADTYRVADDFTEGWAMAPGYGTATADTTAGNFDFGTSGLKVTGRTTHVGGGVFRAYKAMTPVIGGCSGRLIYRVLTTGNLICDATRGGIQVYFTQAAAPASSNTPSVLWLRNLPVTEGWHEVVFNTGANSTSGTPDAWAALTGVVITGSGADGTACEVVFDRLEIWPETGGGQILLGLDDAYYDQAAAAAYALSKGVKCYLAVATDKCGTDGDYLDWDAAPANHAEVATINELAALGVEIVQHYYVCPYSGTDAQIEVYLRRNQYDLIEAGVSGVGTLVHVLPAGTPGPGPTDADRPVPNDILLMREHNRIVRGTAPNWTGGGAFTAQPQQLGISAMPRCWPKRAPNGWWLPASTLSAGESNSDYYGRMATWLAAAKAHGGLVNVFAHLGVTNDISSEQWIAMVDVIAAAQAAGDIRSISFAEYYAANTGAPASDRGSAVSLGSIG